MTEQTQLPIHHQDPLLYESETFVKGLQNHKPPITFDNTRWPEQAKAVLSATSWAYLNGSAGTRKSDDNNLEAFKKWAFIPRRLTGGSAFPDMSVKLFGKEYAAPIGIDPVGVQRIFHQDGEIATSKAAAAQGVPYTFSSASATSIEDVARASGSGERWFQLYWPANKYNEVTKSLLSRAQNNGYEVLMVNVDTYIVGWRPSDMDEGYSPFLRPDRVGVEMGFTDPVYREMFKKDTGKEIEEDMGLAAATWCKVFQSIVPHEWEDLKFLRQHWKGPIVIKGIQCVEDAEMCVKMGMDGIVVSNHGGREVDGNVASLSMLPEIAKAVDKRFPVLYDSGIRSGVDVLKALALGADFVLIGRPIMYGLALGGQAGVEHVLKAFLGEMQLSLHLMGLKSVDKDVLNTSILRQAP